MRAPDHTRRLLRTLERAAAEANVAVSFQSLGETPWASGLFAGTRHRIEAALAAPADAFLAALPEADLPIPGACVADLAVESRPGSHPVITVLVIAD